jgi:hypothetical protein
MNQFPRTRVGPLDMPRLVIGSNWFLGFTHQTQARTKMVKQTMTRERIAEVLIAFAEQGINATMGIRPDAPHFNQAVEDAEQATGQRMIRIGTPHINLGDTPEDSDEVCRTFDAYRELGTDLCMPHQASTDALVNRRTRRIDKMDQYVKLIRERDMLPGLSTHMPETPVYADEQDLDVETYIQIYNAAGFLMQIEIDWVHRMIWQRKRPVLTIKPLAAGRLQPLVGLAFAWATLRPQDMVTVGCYTPDEAKEVIEISQSLLEQRASRTELQVTRSKASLVEH